MLTSQPNPENTVKQMWERLAAGIKEIQNHNASSLSYEEHYRYAYNMVLYKSKPVSFLTSMIRSFAEYKMATSYTAV